MGPAAHSPMISTLGASTGLRIGRGGGCHAACFWSRPGVPTCEGSQEVYRGRGSAPGGRLFYRQHRRAVRAGRPPSAFRSRSPARRSPTISARGGRCAARLEEVTDSASRRSATRPAPACRLSRRTGRRVLRDGAGQRSRRWTREAGSAREPSCSCADGIARVAADPPGSRFRPRCQAATGSRLLPPWLARIYWSDYEPARLAVIAERLRGATAPGGERWCIFDNTTLGAATGNALALGAADAGRRSPTAPELVFGMPFAQTRGVRPYDPLPMTTTLPAAPASPGVDANDLRVTRIRAAARSQLLAPRPRDRVRRAPGRTRVRHLGRDSRAGRAAHRGDAFAAHA